MTLLTLNACSTTTSLPGDQSTAVVKSATSTTVADTYTATATVTAIDPATRKVQLTLANGRRTTVKCGPEVANFKQIQVNDRVKVTATEELAVYLDKGRTPGISGDRSLAAAAIGDKPAGFMTDHVEETVRITAIDTKTRKVTLKPVRRSDIKVAEHIDLANAKLGDSVTIATQGAGAHFETLRSALMEKRSAAAFASASATRERTEVADILKFFSLVSPFPLGRRFPTGPSVPALAKGRGKL